MGLVVYLLDIPVTFQFHEDFINKTNIAGLVYKADQALNKGVAYNLL